MLNLELLRFGSRDILQTSRGIKILSLDGGGLRGLFSLHILKYIIQKLHYSSDEIATRKFISKFDLICGTSTGSIIAMGLLKGKSIDYMINLYKTIGTSIFSGNPYLYSPFRYARYFYGSGYYNSGILKELLQKEYGSDLMYFTPKSRTPAIFIPITDSTVSPWKPFLSRSYQNVNEYVDGTCSFNIVDSIIASCSAPTYFPEYIIGDKTYVDGGCILNNPTEIAIFEAHNMFKDQHIEFILSIGTGSTTPHKHISSSYNTIYDLISIATESELTHKRVYEWCKENEVVYHRFNVPNLGDVGLDETRDYVLENGEIMTQGYMSSVNLEVSSLRKFLI